MTRTLPDLASLASMARDQNLDVRPVILRVQTDLFLSTEPRSKDMTEAFKILACGLIPLVDEATLIMVARKLTTLQDSPPEVLDMLRQHSAAAASLLQNSAEQSITQPEEPVPALTAAAPSKGLRSTLDDTIDELLDLKNDEIDLALVSHKKVVLNARHLEVLILRGRQNSPLAEWLLARHDLPFSDQAILYAHANAEQRKAILTGISPFISLAQSRFKGPKGHGSELAETLVALAARQDKSSFDRTIALALGQNLLENELSITEADPDFLAFALMALNVPPDLGIRIILTLDTTMARITPLIFHLAGLLRHLPRPVAVYCLEAGMGLTIPNTRPNTRTTVFMPAMDPSGVSPKRGISKKVKAFSTRLLGQMPLKG
jgi:hypothetical protein